MLAWSMLAVVFAAGRATYWKEVEQQRLGVLERKKARDPERSKWLTKKRPPLTVPNVTSAVAAAIARPSACVPDGAVMLSMTNAHHAKLRRLQFERVSNHTCFMTRVVSICYGLQGRDVDDGTLGVCVHGPPVPPSDFKRSQYVALNWA